MTKDNDTPNLDEFRKTMKKATKAQQYSGEEGVKSPDANARNEARDFALDYALKNIVKDKKIAEQIIAEKARIADSSYDEWLMHAFQEETKIGTNHLYQNRETIFVEARRDSLESLAKGFLSIPGVEIAGNASHNRLVRIQGEYSELARIIQAAEQKQIPEQELPQVLYNAAVQAGQVENQPEEGANPEEIESRARFNKIFNGILSLSPNIPLMYIKSLAEKRIKQASEALGSNESKADYVLRNIRKLTDDFAEKYDEKKREFDAATDPKKKKDLYDEVLKIFQQKAQLAHMFYRIAK